MAATDGTMATIEGPGDRAQTGTFCSTSGTYFADKDALTAHYKSDFHRYNLKRKVAGLPPVTREWFEARREQLAAGQAATTGGAAIPAGASRVWVDPLTRKKFKTESTYLAHTKSKRYVEALRQAGLNAPPQPTVLVVQQRQEEAAPTVAAPASTTGSAMPEVSASSKSKSAGYKVVPPSGGLFRKPQEGDAMQMSVSPAGDDEGSDWETASEDSDADALVAVAQEGKDAAMQGSEAEEEGEEEWDLCRSLFDNHMSRSFEANLEYMFKNFGFYLPDAEYLSDPEGLIKYLGAKIQYGRVPLYTAGDDATARQFQSLHAVQRHMVDAVRCKMLYDGNEEEYEEFYDYSKGTEQDADVEGKQLATTDAADVSGHVAGYELVVGGDASGAGSGAKVLGSRDLARYYRQKHRPDDDRRSVIINTMLAKYRNLGIATADKRDPEEKRARVHASRRFDRNNLRVFMNANIIRDLPKNVPY